MMCKYFGRNSIKQFIKSKPIRYGIKMWALCGASGFLYDCDIYCGKNSGKDGMLANCAMGSRVVLQMLEQLLCNISPRKLSRYHVYFDNLFCCPDLLVHLKKAGLRATGTVRENRIDQKNNVDKDAPRGTYAVKHDKNSGVNFITVKDSKLVSVLSTAAGVTPQSSVKRYSKELKSKVEIPFPNAFKIYNLFMGGVDIHDMYCNRLLPIIRSKKWTWIIFIRIIQSSITNATVLWNSASSKEQKRTVKDFALSIVKSYMKCKSERAIKHKIVKSTLYKYCKNQKKCGKRTYSFCEDCESFFCSSCLNDAHIL